MMKILRIRSLLRTLILSIAFLAMAASAQPTDIRVGSMIVKMPTDWYQTTIPSDEPYTRAVLASNSPSEEQALMMISVIPKDGRTLASLSSATRNYIATRMDGVLEFERTTTIAGAPAHTFVYEGRSEHSGQGRRKFMRTLIERGNSFYVLQGVANHIPFANHAGTLEDMFNSVQWAN